MRHVLVVNDAPAVCHVVKLALEEDGACSVTTASTAFDAIAAIDNERPNGAIIDAMMPGVTHLEIAKHALSLGVPVLMMTGELDLQEALIAHGIRFVPKPFRIRDLVAETKLLLQQARERHAQLVVTMARLAKTQAALAEVLEHSRALQKRAEELQRHLKRP